MRCRLVPVVLAAVLALGAAGCQLSLASDIGVDADGSGQVEFAVSVDRELADLLDEAGVDLTLGLAEAQAAAGPWELEETGDVPGRELRFRARFDDPSELADLVADLHAGLDGEDPAIMRDVQLDVDAEGRVRFSAEAGLALPTTAGAVGDGITFDVDDLESLLAREGGRAARYDLRLELPGTPRSHDADARDGRTLTWSLPIGEMRAVHAASDPPADRTWLLLVATFLVSAAAAGVAIVALRRRGARLAGARAER